MAVIHRALRNDFQNDLNDFTPIKVAAARCRKRIFKCARARARADFSNARIEQAELNVFDSFRRICDLDVSFKLKLGRFLPSTCCRSAAGFLTSHVTSKLPISLTIHRRKSGCVSFHFNRRRTVAPATRSNLTLLSRDKISLNLDRDETD